MRADLSDLLADNYLMQITGGFTILRISPSRADVPYRSSDDSQGSGASIMRSTRWMSL